MPPVDDPLERPGPSGAEPPGSGTAPGVADPPREAFLHDTLRGVFWTSGGTAVQAALQILVLVVLARLLGPEEFGIIAAALVVTSFSDIFAKLGVGPALVQRETIEERHLETALLVSLLLGSLLGVAVLLAARPAAAFFQVEGLAAVVRALAVLFPVTALGVVSHSTLVRELAFRTTARINVLAYAVGYTLTGIGLAFAGFGVWALVGAVVGERVVAVGMAVAARPPPRRMRWDPAAARDLLRFGAGLTAMRLSNFFALRGDYLVTGRLLGVAALGIYERAYRLMSVPVMLMGGVVDGVLFPILSKMQGDRARLGRAYVTILSLVAIVILPLTAISLVLAPEVIAVFLGDGWQETVAPFSILLFGMYFRATYRIGMVVVQATGAVYRGAWRQAAYAVLVVSGAWIGSRWGLEGVAAGVLVALAGMFGMSVQLAHRLTGHAWRRFALAHVPALGLAAFTGAVGRIAAGALRDAGAHDLVVLVGATAAAAALPALVLWRRPRWLLGPQGVAILEAARAGLRARRAARARPVAAGGPDDP